MQTCGLTRDDARVALITTPLGGPLASASADAFMLYFGHALNAGGVEVPWFGTSWSNLVFGATP